MKKYILYVTAILSLGAMLSGCAQKENIAEVAGGTQIRFSAQMGSFAVKADEAVTPDHVVGLFAAEPVAVSNTLLNWVGSALTPEAPIYWGQYQPIDEPVPFYAYTPYAQGTEMKFAFTVPADQSVEENFAAADLMYATTLSSPKDEAVVLNFGHRMARLIITLDNRLGTNVTGLSFTGIVPTANVDLSIPSVTLAKDVEPVEIKAAPVVLNDEQVAWVLIFPAQTLSSSAVMVTTEEGEVYRVQANSVSFLEGYSYSATVILDEATQSLNFSVTVSDWEDQEVSFTKQKDPGKMEKHTWSLVQYDRFKAPMELQEDGLYYAYFKEYEPYEFRIYRDYGSDNAMYYGFAMENYYYYLKEGETLKAALAPRTEARLETQDDLGFEIWFDEATKTVTITIIPHKWESLGMGTMLETIMSNFRGYPFEDVEVEFREDKNYPGIISVIDPYKNWSMSSTMDNSVEGYVLPLKILDNNQVAIGNGNGRGYQLAWFEWHGEIVVNGYSGQYGSYDPETGFIVFDKGLSTYWGWIDPENNIPLSFTLPGFTRPVTYCDIMQPQFNGFDWEEGPMARIGCQPQFEVKTIKAKAYAGILNEEEVAAKVEDVKDSGITFIALAPDSFTPGQWFDFRVSIPEWGENTIVLYSEAENGQSAYRYVYCN